MTQEPHPLRVAIIGSGASGFFCADYLLRLAQPCDVFMFEQNPTPFGLVRDGVAPDRMNIRGVTRSFARIAEKPGFTWYGNVAVGRDISIASLKECFDAVIVAGGASNPRTLDIQGEHIGGCYNARSFAGWYNGSLEHGTTRPNLSHPAAVVIGAGNAALDIARLLATPPDTLAGTDISSSALHVLQASAVTDIHLVARRGPLQARFAAEELGHLANIPNCSVEIHTDMKRTFEEKDSSELTSLQQAYQKLINTNKNNPPSEKRIHLHFNLSPFGIMGEEKVSGVLFMDDADTPLYIPCGLVISSIGFTGKPIEGLPFDEDRGVIPNVAGRIINDAKILDSMYVAGWMKRGAEGVIGSNKPCCRETVQSILDDRESLYGANTRETKDVTALLKQNAIRFITYRDWQEIDAAEQERGSALGKVREKFLTLDEILSLLR